MPVAQACEVVCDCTESASRFSRLRSRPVQIALAFAAVYLIWGSTFLGIRVAIETIPPMIMAGRGLAAAGTLFFFFLRACRGPQATPSDCGGAAPFGCAILFSRDGPGHLA